MLDTDLAWAAGFLDGEGNFNVAISHGYYHYIRITVENTSLVPIERLRSLFGGAIYLSQRTNVHAKLIYRWTVSSRQAAHVAELVLPYLVLKPDQAKVLLEIHSIKKINGKVSEDVFNARENVRKRLLNINKRGIS